MKRLKAIAPFLPLLFIALVASGRVAHAAQIGGTITTTVVIVEDSELVDDVTCAVTGAPCIAFGASGITLKLNGFTMTGQGNAKTGCGGTATAGEFGIDVNAQQDVSILGPGLVQQFRNQGIRLLNSTGVMVRGVITSTNCASGIIVIGGAENHLHENISVRNGNGGAPCGGI
jgi:hypothetical protein